MHIGIELGLQELNSNLFNTLQDEEKDYYLNRTIEDFVRAVATNEENTIRSILTYADIRKYYEMINMFIKDIPLGYINYQSEGYVESPMPPVNALGEVDNEIGMLYDGVTYRVQTVGVTDLSTFGYFVEDDQENDDTFVCEIDNLTIATGVYIFKGEIYRIVNNPGVFDFTAIGAKSNLPGTQFVATKDLDITTVLTNVILKPIAKRPAWNTDVPSSNTDLYAVDTIELFEFLSSESLNTCDKYITSGDLELDQYYLVLVNGTTDLSSFGGYISSMNTIGLVFKCTTGGTPTWAGNTKLMKVVKKPNRLVKFQDKSSFLKHSYGTTISSPISTMINNKLRVYHDKKFPINGIYLQYVKKPNEVNLTNSIDCNLPVSIHGKIVDWTVLRIAGTTNNPVYNANKDFEITNEQIKK